MPESEVSLKNPGTPRTSTPAVFPGTAAGEVPVLEPEGGGFTLRWKGRTILSHSSGRPCCGLGRTDFSYRIRHGMYRVRRDRRLSWTWAGAWTSRRLGNGGLEIEFPGLAAFELSVKEGRLRLEPRAVDAAAGRLDLRLSLDPREALYGCGEQFSYLELRGKRLRLQVSEPGVGRGPNYVKLIADLHSGIGGWRDNTYLPMPVFVGSRGLSVLAETDAFAIFDFRRRGEALLSFREIPRAVEIGFSDGLAGAVSDLSGRLGRQPAAPDWCQEGVWLGIQGGREVVESKLEKALRAGARVAAVWCQDWQGIRRTGLGKQLYWNWEWDRDLYPEPEAFTASLRARGVRFLGYVNPMNALDSPQYREGAARGFYVKDREGRPLVVETASFRIAALDLSNPGARLWYKEILRSNLAAGGLDGWMADFGEYLPPEGVLASGEDPRRRHNPYAADWAALVREALVEAGAEGRCVVFHRSGWLGTPRQAQIVWAGDQLVNFMRDHGLPSVLVAGLSAGMSGIGQWHFDVGGFISAAWIRRDRELLARSAEFAAFTPFFRSHEGINPGANVQFDSDPETLSRFSRMTRVYAALAPYHKALAREYRETGLPPIRLPALQYPDSPEARAARDQYLYGRDMMVAPALRRGLRSRRVRLPEDDWIGLWDGAARGGGVFRAPAPFGEPPVWYRRSSPFAGLFETVANAARGTESLRPGRSA